jgi:hypothetical protein
MERLTAADLSMVWPDDFGWPQDIGALAILDGSGLLDANGRLAIERVRDGIERRLNLFPPVPAAAGHAAMGARLAAVGGRPVLRRGQPRRRGPARPAG